MKRNLRATSGRARPRLELVVESESEDAPSAVLRSPRLSESPACPTDRPGAETIAHAISSALAGNFSADVVAEPGGSALDESRPTAGVDDDHAGACLPSRTASVMVGAALVVATVSLAVFGAVAAMATPPKTKDVAFVSTAAIQATSAGSAAPVLRDDVPPPAVELDDEERASENAGDQSITTSPLAQPTTGTIVLPPAAVGHRVFLDGKLIEVESLASVTCGRHAMRVGAKGRDRVVLVPCGGDVVVAYP